MSNFLKITLFSTLVLASCSGTNLQPTASSKQLSEIQQRSSSTQVTGPVETLLFCYPNDSKQPRAIPLSYRQLGSTIESARQDNQLFYIPKKEDRKSEIIQACQNAPLKVIPPEYEWVDGNVSGEQTALEFNPPIYGYVEHLKVSEHGPVFYTTATETTLQCYQIIELNTPMPVIMTPAKTIEKKVPLLQKDGRTLQIKTSARIEAGKREDGCTKSSHEYTFERHSESGEVLDYLQNPIRP